jgi:hypothetical protein
VKILIVVKGTFLLLSGIKEVDKSSDGEDGSDDDEHKDRETTHVVKEKIHAAETQWILLDFSAVCFAFIGTRGKIISRFSVKS